MLVGDIASRRRWHIVTGHARRLPAEAIGDVIVGGRVAVADAGALKTDGDASIPKGCLMIGYIILLHVGFYYYQADGKF